MLHPFLSGEYELILDEKGRLLIPSDIRNEVEPEKHGKAWFTVRGINKMPWIYNQRYYEGLIAKAPQEMTPGFDQLAFDHLLFARASKVEPDKQGRLVLPERLTNRSDIKRGDPVMLVGSRDHLEVWKRDLWKAHMDDLEAREEEITKLQRAQQQAMLAAMNRPPATGREFSEN